MLKLIIPALSVAILSHSVATAQYFGTKYPASSGYKQPARPIRIARATDTEPLSSPSDNLDDLDALDALDAPASSEIPPPANVPLEPIAPPSAPQSLDAPAALEPPALPDMPERIDLPSTAELDPAAPPQASRGLEAEITANDFDSLEPITPQSILAPEPTPVTPIPGPIDFGDAIRQQQNDAFQLQARDNTAQYYSAARYRGGAYAGEHSTTSCGCQGETAGQCGCSMPYRHPILPPPNSFHGHFRSNPCYFDLWATYPAEAAAACAHNREKLSPCRTGCATCELVAPKPCPCR